MRETTRLSKDEYPTVHKIINQDVYVDDCLSGETSADLALQRADEIELVLNRGGFSLKGFTITGRKPLESLSQDGKTINVAGMKWEPEKDLIMLDVSELNFAKKNRGKKPTQTIDVIPEKLTRRHCVSKVAEIFDLTGKVTPLTAAMKLDLHELVVRKLDWDDKIPDDLRNIWDSHFQMMKEINSIKFKRAIIPEDAINLEIDTIDTGDASKNIICVAIYARFQRRNSSYSCLLIFSQSKLVPDGMTLPRAELMAATMNTHTGEVVHRSFGNHWKEAVKLTDSQIVLHWISNNSRPLKQYVRNRVIEIQRFTKISDWMYVQSKDVIADLGTRKRATIKDVDQNSSWINGYPWMRKSKCDFPAKSIEQVKLDVADKEAVRKEYQIKADTENPLDFNWDDESQISFKDQNQKHAHSVKRINNIPDEVKKHYMFSSYLIDPNRHRFKTVVRILAYVIKFINILKLRRIFPNSSTKNQASTKSTTLSADEIRNSEYYFFSIFTSYRSFKSKYAVEDRTK